MQRFDVIIIGAGASGLLAAISAASQKLSVLLIEKNEKPARKLMITGKGRCNITNSADLKTFLSNVYPEPRFLYSAFKTFFTDDILELLEKSGLSVKLERGGRYFPISDKAVDVVDTLNKKALSLGCAFKFSTKVLDVICENNAVVGVKVENRGSLSNIYSDKVIVCTGGLSYPKTGSDGDGYTFAKKCGHSVTSLLPALVPLESNSPILPNLSGLTLKNVNVSLWINGKRSREDFGEMEFTDFGFTGPIILTLSRWAVIAINEKKTVRLVIDLKPALDEKKLDTRILRDLNDKGKTKLKDLFKEWLPMKLIPAFIELLNINQDKLANQLLGEDRRKIVFLMKNFSFDVVGYRSFDEAIITNGGISIKEINPKNMESKKTKGLFFAGEVLDLDANTGGYNLQIAYSTGWLAGSTVSVKTTE